MRDIIHMKLGSGRRIIAVSDIHGHADVFDALMKKIRFSEDDLLVIIGDMIECGPDSLGALRRAMELVRRGSAIALCGNWEHFFYEWFMDDGANEALKARCLQLMAEDGSCLVSQMCRELGVDFGEHTVMAEIMPRIRREFSGELEFMANLPVILDTGDYFFVHGGVPALDEEALRGMDQYGMLKNDCFADSGVCFDRWVIVGHWPVSLYDADMPNSAPHINGEKRIVSIDGGMGKHRSGQLNALMLRAGKPGEFSWEHADFLPRVRALDMQMGSENPLHIRWYDRQVEVLSEKGDICRVRHLATGREMDVPSGMIWSMNGEKCATNATDYRLPIRPGDMISVIIETSMGIYGKRDSVTGWYVGRYEKA